MFIPEIKGILRMQDFIGDTLKDPLTDEVWRLQSSYHFRMSTTWKKFFIFCNLEYPLKADIQGIWFEEIAPIIH